MNPDDRRRELIDQLQYLGQMSSTETALFHQMAASKCGVGITDMKTVSILVQEGPMTAGEIALRLSLTTGAVTNVIDRLERKGMARRSKDTKDRRKVIVSVIPESLTTTAAIYQSMGHAFELLLANYSAEQLEFLVEYLKASIELHQKEIAKLAGD